MRSLLAGYSCFGFYVNFGPSVPISLPVLNVIAHKPSFWFCLPLSAKEL